MDIYGISKKIPLAKAINILCYPLKFQVAILDPTLPEGRQVAAVLADFSHPQK